MYNSETVTSSEVFAPVRQAKEEAFETPIFRIENNQFEPYVHAPWAINNISFLHYYFLL